jgi:hypothetical protein
VHAVLARSDDAEVACCSQKLVRSVMAELGLAGCQPRGYKTTTQPDPEPPTAPQDLVGRDFSADRPGIKLVGDISYIRTWTGWLYLATVIDCCSREVIGWSMADHMRTSLVCDAISMAAGRGQLEPGAIFHSDRGSQYTANTPAANMPLIWRLWIFGRRWVGSVNAGTMRLRNRFLARRRTSWFTAPVSHQGACPPGDC